MPLVLPWTPDPDENVVVEARAFLAYFESMVPVESHQRFRDVVAVATSALAVACLVTSSALFGFLTIGGVACVGVAMLLALAIRARVVLAVVRRRHWDFMAEIAADAYGIAVRHHAIEYQRFVVAGLVAVAGTAAPCLERRDSRTQLVDR